MNSVRYVATVLLVLAWTWVLCFACYHTPECGPKSFKGRTYDACPGRH